MEIYYKDAFLSAKIYGATQFHTDPYILRILYLMIVNHHYPSLAICIQRYNQCSFELKYTIIILT